MARRILLILILTLIAAFGSVTSTLDFTQFHLPPCCYISPNGNQFSGYAALPSKIDSVSAKANGVKGQASSMLEDRQVIKSDFEVYNLTARGTTVNSTEQYKVTKPEESAYTTTSKPLIYRLVVPLTEILQERSKSGTTYRGAVTTVEPPETTRVKPPTSGRVLFPEIKNRSTRYGETSKFKRDSLQTMVKSKSKLLEEIISLELEDAESEKSLVGKKSLSNNLHRQVDYDTENLKPEHRSLSNEISIEFEEKWEPIKLRNLKEKSNFKSFSSSENSFNNNDNKDPILASAQNPIKRQVLRKMPTSWLKNLRRALYQSITAGVTSQKAGTRADQELNREKNPQKNTILFPETWKSIQSATVQFVDKMSQAVSQLPNAIYLPLGQGPVVSGILAMTKDGGLQLRVASELYEINQGANARQDSGCHCYLLNEGETITAYWTISRISNANGQPALQYLVYPLPNIVPTPPELIRFNNDYMFQPSPIDPLSEYYEHSHNPQFQTFDQNQNQIDDFSNPMPPQSPPKFYHELPNGHHRLEIHDDNRYQPIAPLPQHIPMTGGVEKNLPQHPGVLIENNRQYTPEFIDLYRAAIQHHFQEQDGNNGNHPFHNTPYSTPEEIQGMGYPQRHTPISGFTPPNPTPLLNTNEEFVQERPMIMLPIQPVGPTPFTVQGGQQITRAPNFPKSIQDIISPFAVPNQADYDPMIVTLEQPLPPTQHPIQVKQPIQPPLQHTPQNAIRYNPDRLTQQIPVTNYPQKDDAKVEEQYPPASNIQSTAKPHNQNVYKEKDDFDNNKNSYTDDEKRQEVNNVRDRPYTIANVLDNDKKYYPRRKPSRVYVKEYNVQKDIYRRKSRQEINDTRGYILNF